MKADQEHEMRLGVVIVAGGTGIRMGEGIPKQYRDVAGKAVILHTLERFLKFDPEISIVVVLAPGHREYWENIAGSFYKGIALTNGGGTRYDSVKNGLQRMDPGVEIIGIHDAVRPLVSMGTLDRCYTSASLNGSAIPVTEMDETVRILKTGGHSEHLDRSLLRRVQTPQVFRGELIRKAYQLPFHPSFTDDASVYESLYGEVHLVEGNPENIKITTPADLKLAGLLLEGFPS
ncbi:MAG: 2-C-methyl-D-erythritol 4-phosphate cytidylyltransferase [Bacteroidales bacterium]